MPENRTESRKIDAIDMYMNKSQALVSIVDPNKFIGVEGRGTGKTTGIIAPRVLKVAEGMPREISIISHKSFVALLTNVMPSLLSSLRRDIKQPDGTVRPMLQDGIDFVVGQKDLPAHFTKPRAPLLEPERSIVFANGHVLRAVAVDRADSVAGSNIVHAFFEEMKYSDGEKLRSRIIPAIRTSRIGAGSDACKHHLHGGFTGVSDIGRVSIGESNWFLEYEDQMDEQLIADIITLSLKVNEAQINLQQGIKTRISQTTIRKWTPILNALRKKAVLFQRVSTFVNRTVLGFDYFQTQKDALSESEFLSSICSIGDRNKENLFFEKWDEAKHTFTDSYKDIIIAKLTLTSTFHIDAGCLKHYDPSRKLLFGFDPGAFASFVVGQWFPEENTLRIIKEFFVYAPEDLPDLAQNFNAFFGPAAKSMKIDLYYDRAGNKHNSAREKETDARQFRYELTKYGWRPNLMSLGMRTIFYWEHYRLWKRLLSNQERSVPRILIDANECPNLVSAMYCCKKVPGSTPVELDKSPERKVPIDLQAGLTPQIPSALTYLVWGLFGKQLSGPRESSSAGAGIGSITM